MVPQRPIHTLAILDAGLPGLSLLLGALEPGVVAQPVRATDHWCEQLAAAVLQLRGQNRLEPAWRLAVIAHGRPGAVAIGRQPITTASVREHAARWQALAPTAIDLYACHTGADPTVLAALAQASGAVVRASAGPIGHHDRQASWQLELSHHPRGDHHPAGHHPARQRPVPFSPEALAAWPHTLAATLTVGAGQPYATIQAAINAASAGDTINVLAGTYSENITINKPLTLLGAQAGVKATGSTRTGGETILNGTGASSSSVVFVAADNVTIDGFAITPRINPSNASQFARDAINVQNTFVAKPNDSSIGAYRSGITIQNNWIYSNIGSLTGQQQGILFGESPQNNNPSSAVNAEVANVTISGNYINVLNTAASGGPRGIVFGNQFQGTLPSGSKASILYSDVAITDNTVFASNIPLFQSQTQTRLDDVSITGNTFGNSRSGVSIASTMTNSTFNYNTIQDVSAGTGLTLSLIDSTASNNTIQRIGGAAFVLSGGRSTDPTYFAPSANATISNNTIRYNDVALPVGSTQVTGLNIQPNVDGTGVSVAGTTGVDANTLTLSGNTFIDGGVNTGVAVAAIAQRSVGTTLNAVNASPNLFNGTPLTGSSSQADLFAIADRIADVVDATNLGSVTIKSGHIHVSPNSYWSPSSTTTADVARAVAAAPASGTVWMQPGAYAATQATTTVDNLTLDIPAGVTGFNGLVLGSGVTQATLTGAGSGQLIGNSGNNVLIGNSGTSSLSGADGNDSFMVTISAFSSGNSISGGAGVDTLTLSGSGTISDSAFSQVNTVELLSLAGGDDSLSLGSAFAASGISTISAADGSDSLLLAGDHSLTMGSADALVISGVTYSGFEAVSIGGSNSTLLGTAGNDALTITAAGSALAPIPINGITTYDLGAGQDAVSITGTGSFTSLIGGSGNDSLTLSRSSTADALTITASGSGSISGAGSFSGFEQLDLQDGNDSVTLSAASSSSITLAGGSGTDGLRVADSDSSGNSLSITSASGGGQGTLGAVSFSGLETIALGAGADTISLSPSVLSALAGNLSLHAGGGTDRLLLTAPGSISDAAFSSLQSMEVLQLADGGNTLTLASNAQTAGIGAVAGGSGADRIDATATTAAITISGGGGNDTITLATLSSADSLDGGSGSDSLVLSSAGTLTDAAFTNVSSFEVLTLANGSNTITLAAEANEAGFTTVVGGSGADSIDLTASSSPPTLALGDGSDTVVVAGSFDLSDHSGIEVLQLNSSIAASLSGDAAANLILTSSGNDTLDGGAGNDTLSGGGGNDLYITDSSSDVVVEAAAGGTDTVQSSASYALPAEVETLLLTGSDSINGVGNSLANLIIGTSGNNILDGLGGADTMVGGAGNDYYGVNSSLDVVTELSGEGSDTIFSGVSLSLPANVDALVLSGLGAISAVDAGSEVLTASSHGLTNGDAIVVASNRGSLQANTPYYLINATANSFQLASAAGGTALNLGGSEAGLYTVAYTSGSSYNLSAIGNSLDNVLVGNAGSNIFNFNYSGGGGNDTMQGGAGNDFYFFDSSGDVAIEASDAVAGYDVIYSTVDIPALADNIEELQLQGSADLIATGNGGANKIFGNAGNNTIDGGRGIDTLVGGTGHDLYLVDVHDDIVLESASEGSDTIRARESYTAPLNVERVELSGSGRHNLTGNSQANALVGNDSANLLDGAGGNDTLEGLGGNDSYVVDASGDLVIETSGGGRDTITSAVTTTLPAHVETLVLSGSASLNGSGNSDANTIIGNDAANSLDGGGGADLLIGAGGNDTYLLDHQDDGVQELAGGGTDTVISSVAVAELFENVEVVILSGNADLALTGNSANNWLLGNAGANSLDGGAGDDTLQGGAGNDLYRVDSTGDLVIEASGGGTDTISSSVSLASLPDHVETLVAQGRSALLLTGNGLANTVIGGRGADTLDGGAGSDTLQGLGGSDTYLVDNASDLVLEGSGPLDGRNDLVIASTSITSLPDNIETLVLSGSANLSATGNSGRNTITGNSGNNTLDGGGGRDQLIGGAGHDLYLIDSSDDRVIELAGDGSDTLSASISIASLPENVEVLVLSGSADLNGTGNAAANTLLGNAGANRLDGGGGSDTLIGGGGNDFYGVDSADDLVTEAAGGGSDTISTSVSLSALPDHVEVGSLNSSAPLSLVGNSLANLLIGNRGDDTLHGAAGADTLDGGRGSDVYSIDNSGDLVIEAPRAGIDSVLSSISTSLADNVEHLTLLDSGGAINGSGNSGNNTLTGNASANLLLGLAGNDVLSGGGGNDTLDGGAGADGLSGGSGADLFRFSSSDDIGRYSKVDSISDFNPSEGDRIDLSALASSLGRSLSWLGTSPYSGSAGQVRYDSDGGLLGIDLTGNARNTTSIRLSPGLSITSGNLILG